MTAPEHERKKRAQLTALPFDLPRIEASLRTHRLATKVHYLREVDSTNNYARRLAEGGAREGEIVIAEQQTQGRGRSGRSWVSPPYVNLYCSVILRPKLAPVHAPQITLMAAVALGDAVASFLPCLPTIKWPNDIMVQGKKLAGILTESSCHGEKIDFVILGIGVNLNFPPDLMPEPIRERATSLMVVRHKSVSREAFVCRLIQDLDRCYGILEESGFDGIAGRWESRNGLHGRRVRVEVMGQLVTGTARGIDKDGALIIACESGELQRVIAGDVSPLEE